MTLLIQNQAGFLARVGETDRAQIEFQRQQLELERRHLDFERKHLEFERKHQEYERETAERFARIEIQMAEIIRVLNEHTRQLASLTEAVREKIGFKQP